MKAKRKYKKKKRGLSGTDSAAKTTTQKVTDSLLQTGKDLLIGVIGGGIAGAIIGKPSLLIGAGVTGYGHYSKKPTLTVFGVGMMAASGFNSSMHGIDGFTKEDVKVRVMDFKDSFTSKLFLDKIFKKKSDGSTNGVGAVQYYEHSNETKELDFSALDRLQNQVIQSGIDYNKNMQGISSQKEVRTRPINGEDDSDIDFTMQSY